MIMDKGEKKMDKGEKKMETFELMYASGGHGGPYMDLKDAVSNAKRIIEGYKNDKFFTVYVVPRNKVLIFDNAICIVTRDYVRYKI